MLFALYLHPVTLHVSFAVRDIDRDFTVYINYREQHFHFIVCYYSSVFYVKKKILLETLTNFANNIPVRYSTSINNFTKYRCLKYCTIWIFQGISILKIDA